jgi:hypothetical protein
VALIKIKINPEFESLCPPLSPDELGQLEASLKTEGCRDPLVVWKAHNILLDGHNRFALCQKHGISYAVVEVEVADRDAARAYILHNQLGRRNLSPEAASYLRGRRYLDEKAEHGGKREASGQTVHLKTSERLAQEFSVNEKTIRRDGLFAQAVDKIVANCGDDCRKVILSQQYDLTRGLILKMAKWSSDEQKEFLDELQQRGRRPRKKHVRPSSRQQIRLMARRITDLERPQAMAVLREAAKLLGVELVESSNSETTGA